LDFSPLIYAFIWQTDFSHGSLALSRPYSGSIEFANGNSVRMDRGPTMKTICMFLLASSITCLTTIMIGSSRKLMARCGAILPAKKHKNQTKEEKTTNIN